MRLHDLDQVEQYNHIYLSPHLDDAVLSCGGAILLARQRGERVLVVTLCTAAPAPEGPFSTLAREFHHHWGLQPEQVVAARLREDAAAMERLGADFLWAGFLDAIYRAPDAYTSRESLFGTPTPGDPLLSELTHFIAALRGRAPHATMHTPLGVGFHVDHQITHEATMAGGENVLFYEDFPYSAYPGAVQRRLSALRHIFTPNLQPIDTVLEAKIEAIAAYASQLDELFRTAPMDTLCATTTGRPAVTRARQNGYGKDEG